MHSMRACICIAASRETDSTEVWSCILQWQNKWQEPAYKIRLNHKMPSERMSILVPIQHMRDRFCTINLPEALF